MLNTSCFAKVHSRCFIIDWLNPRILSWFSGHTITKFIWKRLHITTVLLVLYKLMVLDSYILLIGCEISWLFTNWYLFDLLLNFIWLNIGNCIYIWTKMSCFLLPWVFISLWFSWSNIWCHFRMIVFSSLYRILKIYFFNLLRVRWFIDITIRGLKI